MGVLEAIGSNVPNFMKDVLNFVNDVPRVPNYVRRWGSTPNLGSKIKSWTIHVQMGVLKAIGSDVPNFVKDVPRVPNCVPRWGQL